MAEYHRGWFRVRLPRKICETNLFGESRRAHPIIFSRKSPNRAVPMAEYHRGWFRVRLPRKICETNLFGESRRAHKT